MTFQELVTVTNDLIANYPEDQAWNNSPFNRIRPLPPGSKGAIGRDIASALLYSAGLTVMLRRTQLRVNGQGVLVRIALMWEQGIVKFQNMRDAEFDHVLCLALLPDQARGWLIPKEEIWQDGQIRTDRPGITSQHRGADAWITVNIEAVHPWMAAFGGTLEDVTALARTSL